MTNTSTIKGEGCSWWVLIIALMGLITLLVACGEAPPSTDAQRTPLAAAMLAHPSDSMHLTSSELEAHRKAFTDNYSLESGALLTATEQEIPWEDLATWVVVGAQQHGVRFEYGLRDSSIVLGLVRLKLDSTGTPGLFNYQLPDSLYELADGKLLGHEGDKWREQRQYMVGDSTTYFAQLLRLNSDGKKVPLIHGVDAQANVMPWELELLPLYEANMNDHPDSTFHAVFTCIAAADSANVLQHRIAVHLRLRPLQGSGYRDLLDDSYVPGSPFFMHGADFGEMCPSACNTYSLIPQ
ncbi:MAG: hypothetical protein MUE88_07165 [Flavobacteriales bacterium]|jgi:hypothetical protein|nr:hypothetical protein [Flavobacteriales bacterium]